MQTSGGQMRGTASEPQYSQAVISGQWKCGRASQIEIRQRDDGTLLGYFYAALEPDVVRQLLAAEGLRAFAEDVGIYIPEINDPQETPFYHRPNILVGEITALDSSAHQTILGLGFR